MAARHHGSRLRVGFDVSAIYPWRAGGSTYALELLRHLLDDPNRPELVLLDGSGRGALEHVRAEFSRQLDGTPAHGTRMLPLLHVTPGPWLLHPKAHRYSMRFDSFFLTPTWQLVNVTPTLARRRMPGVSDVDVCHWSGDAFLRLPGAVHIVTVHDTIPLVNGSWHPRGDRLNHFVRLHLIARLADRIIVDSESARGDVERVLGVSRARIDVIPLAAGPQFVPEKSASDDAVIRKYGLVSHDYVIFVSTIEPRKNVVRLAQAFARVIERNPGMTARLVLAGQMGWMTGPIERGLAATGLGDRLVMPGRLPEEDLPALLRGARCSAYVSLYEGFGLPPLEAMSCGTPVVAANTSSLPEVVGDAGLSIEPLDVRAIAEALEAILTDDDLHRRLSAASLARAAQFSWQRTTQLTVEAYHRAAKVAHASRHA